MQSQSQVAGGAVFIGLAISALFVPLSADSVLAQNVGLGSIAEGFSILSSISGSSSGNNNINCSESYNANDFGLKTLRIYATCNLNFNAESSWFLGENNAGARSWKRIYGSYSFRGETSKTYKIDISLKGSFSANTSASGNAYAFSASYIYDGYNGRYIGNEFNNIYSGSHSDYGFIDSSSVSSSGYYGYDFSLGAWGYGWTESNALAGYARATSNMNFTSTAIITELPSYSSFSRMSSLNSNEQADDSKIDTINRDFFKNLPEEVLLESTLLREKLESSSKSVPEPGFVFGLLTFSALGAGSMLKRKQNMC
ncbi:MULTISPECIES: hypothetical protein [Cyanophyceae]|uniref:hypothetical protein n=1 Tax=Cyanophyceae TaxID=3028117 RepID=UPI001686FD9C|nr:hypothetical protein [Trichocoleus sp. FACHB-69]